MTNIQDVSAINTTLLRSNYPSLNQNSSFTKFSTSMTFIDFENNFFLYKKVVKVDTFVLI